MKLWSFVLGSLFIIFSASCSEFSSADLHGKWEAVVVIEEGDTLQVDYPSIQLHLNESGTYQYNGTLNYKEAGNWQYKSKHLLTTDTLKLNSPEKAVLISSFQDNSFEMTMEENGKKRMMKMSRINN